MRDEAARPTPQMKTDAMRYFHREADRYAERYVVPASSDVLWHRHRALLQMLRSTGLPKGSRIVDLGCGPGVLSRDLAREGYSGVGLDGAAAMIQRCRTEAAAGGIADRWQYGVGDVEAVPFENASFDAAISAGVIEYLPSDDRLLSEVKRVLRPGGRFLLCVTNTFGYTVSLYPVLHLLKRVPGIVPAASFLRRRLVGGTRGAMDFGFLPRKHRPSEIRRRLAESGFRIEADRYAQFTLLPSPFCALLTRLHVGFDAQLEVLDRTPLRVIGSCYLLSARKEED